MKYLMEETKKYIVADELIAESLIEEFKTSQEGTLIDYKVSVKETIKETYCIVTLKTRYLTLSEAKEKIE